MKYFTPELLALGLTRDDEQLNEQERLWDEAGDRYVAYLESIQPHMPAGLRHMKDSYYLHDGLVQGMGQQGKLFLIVVQLDTPPQSLLSFQYDLVDEPVIIRDALPEGLRTTAPIVDWQYDEIEMVPGRPPTWVQSILFNIGWEVRLHFRDVQVLEVQTLVPIPEQVPSTGAGSREGHPVVAQEGE